MTTPTPTPAPVKKKAGEEVSGEEEGGQGEEEIGGRARWKVEPGFTKSKPILCSVHLLRC